MWEGVTVVRKCDRRFVSWGGGSCDGHGEK